MTEMDLDAVAVFYTTPGGQTSPRVTLREIVAVNVVHAGAVMLIRLDRHKVSLSLAASR